MTKPPRPGGPLPPARPLARQAAAEAVGTGFLVAAVVGSGIAAHRLSPRDAGLQLLESALVTGAALAALILALQPVSAAFNPLVTVLERAYQAIGTREAAVLIGAQVAGGGAGAVAANLMFGCAPVSLSHHHRAGAGVWLGEAVATLETARPSLITPHQQRTASCLIPRPTRREPSVPSMAANASARPPARGPQPRSATLRVLGRC